MKLTKIGLIVLSISALTIAGCTSSLSGTTYSRDDARQGQLVQIGTIVSLTPVQLEGTKSPIGTLAGAAIGGIAGNSVGGGRGQSIATVLGAVAGGIAGSAAEEGITRTQGVEITVRYPNNEMRSYVQAADNNNPLSVGQEVRVLTNRSGESRVVRL